MRLQVHVEQAPQLVRHLSLYENLTLGYKTGKKRPPVEHVCEVCKGLGLSEHWIDYLRKTEAKPEATGGGGFGKKGLGGFGGSGSLLASKLKKAARWMDHAGVSLEDVGEGANFQAAERPQNAIKAAEVMLQGELEDDDDEQAWESRLSATDKQILHLARAFLSNPHLLVMHRPWANFDGPQAERLLKTIRSFVANRGTSAAGQTGLLARTVIFTCSPNDERAIEAADAFVTVGIPQGGASVTEAAELRLTHSKRSLALQRLLGDAAQAPHATHAAQPLGGGASPYTCRSTPSCRATSSESPSSRATDTCCESTSPGSGSTESHRPPPTPPSPWLSVPTPPADLFAPASEEAPSAESPEEASDTLSPLRAIGPAAPSPAMPDAHPLPKPRSSVLQRSGFLGGLASHRGLASQRGGRNAPDELAA